MDESRGGVKPRDEKRLLRPQRQLAGYKLLIIDELGPAHPSRPYPADEWRQLQAQSKQALLTPDRTLRRIIPTKPDA